jgi:hypothetical protein
LTVPNLQGIIKQKLWRLQWGENSKTYLVNDSENLRLFRLTTGAVVAPIGIAYAIVAVLALSVMTTLEMVIQRIADVIVGTFRT